MCSSLYVRWLLVGLVSALFCLARSQPGGGSEQALQPITYASGFPMQRNMVWAVHVQHPFAFYDSTIVGNARFTGFIPDLALQLEQLLNVNFTFVLGHAPDPSNEVKTLDLLKFDRDSAPPGVAVADLAGGAIHVSANRSLTVRFSTPYYQSGYRLIVAIPTVTHDPLSFGAPFDDLLWLCVAIEILLIAITVYLMEAPVHSIADESDLQDGTIAGFLDALYMSCTFMLGTADKAPKTWGGKLALLAHGWFMLIIVASYTANLASFLVAGAISPSVSQWSDITASKGGHSLALPRDSGQMTFLEYEAKHYGYSFNVTWTDTMQEAFDLVASGAVDATFEDEAFSQYYLLNERANRCDLMAVGRPFHDVAYALAFHLDNVDFIPFSEAIVYLREIGEVGKLAVKYQVGLGGEAAETAQVAACVGNAGSGVLIIEDFWGLIGIILGVIFLAAAITAVERWRKHASQQVAPEASEDAKVGGGGSVGVEGKGGDANAVIPVHGVGNDEAAVQAAISAGVEAGVKAALERYEARKRGGGSEKDAASDEKAGMS